MNILTPDEILTPDKSQEEKIHLCNEPFTQNASKSGHIIVKLGRRRHYCPNSPYVRSKYLIWQKIDIGLSDKEQSYLYVISLGYHCFKINPSGAFNMSVCQRGWQSFILT